MPEIIVHLQENKIIGNTMTIQSQITIEELKDLISNVMQKQNQTFDVYLDSQILDNHNLHQNLTNMTNGQEITLEIISKNNISNEVMLILEYGMETVRLHAFVQETVEDLKRRVGGIFGCLPSQFDLMAQDQILKEKDKISNLNIKNNTIVTIKRKIPMEGGLGSKIKMTASILSSSDPADQKSQQPPNSNLEVNSIQKKNSCCSSLSNIKQHEGHRKMHMKTSSIELFSHDNSKDSQKNIQEHRLNLIQDIKETKSFGSLQDSKTDELDIEVTSEDKTIVYRFTCPLGCKVGQVRTVLSRQERVNIQDLSLLDIDDKCLIESLGEADELPKLIFKVKKANENFL